MRDFLKGIEGHAIWLLFFATTVYGHVALKVAVDQAPGDTRQAIRAVVASGWGWSACSAWCLSCLLWAAALSKHPLVQANALSSLRYVFIGLAAWVLLGEQFTWTQAAGAALITVGILLIC